MQKENFTKKSWFMKPLSFVVVMLLWVGASYASITPTTFSVTPNTPYTPGTNVTFTCNSTFVVGSAEYVDKLRITFPTGVDINQATVSPASGGGTCGSNAGVRTFPTTNSVEYAHNPYPGPTGSGCGFWSSGTQTYTITVAIPANFTGPLVITANFTGDGWPISSPQLSTQTVSIAQAIPCVYTCPNDITVNLNKGECSAVVNYDVHQTGCYITGLAPASITENGNTVIIQDALSFFAQPESHWRAYDLNLTPYTGGFTMNSLTMGSWNSNIIQVRVYTYTGTVGAATLNTALMTLVGQSLATPTTGTGAAGPLFTIPLTAGAVIPAGAKFVVEQRTSGGGLFGVASNYGGQTQPSYISTASYNAGQPVTYASLGYPQIHNIQILNGLGITQQLAVPYQTTGLPSGSKFPYGQCITNTFEFVAPGTTGPSIHQCKFQVCVNEYTTLPGQQLSCTGNVQLSVGADCKAKVGGGDLLTSGEYGCYDKYIVEVYQNGVLIPGSPNVTFKCGGNNVYTAKVIDPTNPNNACWSNLTVEDKLPPVLTCVDAVVPCGTNLDPYAASNSTPSTQLKGVSASYLAPILDNQTTSTLFDVSLPACQVTGGLVLKEVDLELAHTWTNDVTARLVSPSGQQITLFAQPLCTGDNMKVVLRDDAVKTNADLINQCNACASPPPACYAEEGTFKPAQPLSTYALTLANASGQWKINTSDAFSGDQGQVLSAKLKFEFQGIPFCSPNAATIDACDPNPTLVYTDKVNFDNQCVGPYIKQVARTWKATDCSGNVAQCTQIINVEKATIGTLVWPHNYDNLDLAALPCTAAYPTTAVTGIPGGQGCNIQSTFVDQVINVCQASYKVVRTWTVLDWCTGQIATHDQIIKVLDQVGPTLTCPTPDQIIVQSYSKPSAYYGCTAHVLLPWVPVSDNCSTFNNMDVVVCTKDAKGNVYCSTDPGADNYFEFDVPLGNYVWTYTVTDDCGNTSTCTVASQVKDLIEPLAICESYHQVSLTDSITYVTAESFDDGSYDVCGPVTFLARRLDNPKCPGNDATPFAATVPFYCCDVNGLQDVTVELRVLDGSGNFNTCWSTVHVEDKIRPTIVCPPDITVWCGQPYTPTAVDTTIVHNQIDGAISDVYAHKYQFPLTVQGFPKGSKIWDLDVSLDIKHSYTNQLEITLLNPYGVHATIMSANQFPGCYGQNIINTFNDQAYDIDYYNTYNVKIPANTICSATKNPSIGTYNTGTNNKTGETWNIGQTRPPADHLKVFNGYPLNNVNSKSFANVQYNEIDVQTNRMSNFEIFNLLNSLGLVPGQRVTLRYDAATNGTINGLEVGSYYTWLIIDPFTLELLPENSTDIVSVPVGSTHKFVWSSIWILQVWDNAPLAGGVVNSIDLHIAWGLPTALTPVAHDNTEECGLKVTWSDLDQPDPCYNNVIRRRWVATDNSPLKNSRNCIQRISFEDETPFVVQFPCDATITCDNANTPINTFDINEYVKTHGPVHSGDCESVGIEPIIHELTVVPDACRKYIIHWKVIDWCEFDINNLTPTPGGIALSYDQLTEWFPKLPWHNQCDYFIPGFPFNILAFEDDGDGYFEHTQYVKVLDKSKPVFTSCKDTVICSYAACNDNVTLTTNATDVCTASALIQYSYKIDLFNDGSTQTTGTGNTFTGNVPFGKHRITWTATDGCGNYSTCSYIFYVKDCKKPTPVCINGLSAPNMPIQKVVTIWATDWESGSSYDNCCAHDDLVHRVIKTGQSDHQTPPTTTSVTFDCTEIGSQPVEVWIGDCGYDENGDGVISDNERNWDFCNTFILVTDNDGVCGTTMAAVAGGVETETGKMVKDVTMTAVSSGKTVTTSNNGLFTLSLPLNQAYTIIPSKDLNPLNGVNTLDLVYITNHILGKKALTSGYKKVAADINKDKKITTGDLVQLRQLILHITNNFPANTSWRFVDKAYSFTTNNEQAENFPEVKEIANLTSAVSANFIGVKVGDVTNDASPTSSSASNEVRSGGTLKLGVAEQDLVAGQEYKVNFTARDFNNIAGYQFTIGYDVNTLDFVGLEGKAADINGENFGLTNLEKGMITTSWNGKSLTTLNADDVMFTLTFKASKAGKLSKAINVNSSLTPAVAFNGNEESMDVALEFNTNNGVVSSNDFELYQNQPNPFKEFTTISFTLPQASKATLTIYDVAGKVVKAINGDYAKGLNNVNIQRSDIPAAGVLYYQLDTDTNSAVKKMIIIE